MTKEEMCDVIKQAAQIREDSYSKKAGRYTLTCTEAAVKASPKNPEMGWLIGLALDGWWNNALDWADKPHD